VSRQPIVSSFDDKVFAAEGGEQQQKVVFEDPIEEKLKFKSDWIVWEHYDTDDYQKSMR